MQQDWAQTTTTPQCILKPLQAQVLENVHTQIAVTSSPGV